MDSRFSKLSTDPRFIKLKKNETKTEIDSRFSHIFTSQEFVTKKLDSRGRKVKDTGNELLKYYKLDDEVDYARGEGNEESSEEEFSEEEELEPDTWAEPEIPTGEESYRLACVNLDWDHVKASDLFKLFDGFKPQNGEIKKVSIFPSEFGKESMLKESFEGPPTEIFKTTLDTKKSTQNDDGKDFNMVALRKYQMDRLRYYYAVIECDSISTAKAIFENCDGAEFESSANLIDLRYIPDEMEFDDEPKDVARELPIIYESVDFVTEALQHSKVSLTWDADDVDRQKTTKRHFSKQDLKDMDFKAFLATDSESEVDEELKNKYKSLLAGDEEEDEGEDMEITFAPGLSEKAAKLLEEKKLRETEAEETVFERQLRQQKEKKKLRKASKLSKTEEGVELDSDEKEAFSDPFFQTNLDSEISDSEEDVQQVPKPKSLNEKKKKTGKKMTKEERLAKAKSKAELELLLHDENEKVTHFNSKDIIKAEKSKSKKQKKKLEKADLDIQKEFQIDLNDPRFTALIEDHEYFIDPTNPHFKKTTTMAKILEKKRNTAQIDSLDVKPNSAAITKDLIASVKRKVALRTSKSSKRQKK